MKRTNTFCGQDEKFHYLKKVVNIVTTLLYRVNIGKDYAKGLIGPPNTSPTLTPGILIESRGVCQQSVTQHGDGRGLNPNTGHDLVHGRNEEVSLHFSALG
jgi:hypothetical protein